MPEGAAVTAAASDETPSISGTFISATRVPSELQGEPGDESDFTYDGPTFHSKEAQPCSMLGGKVTQRW